MKVVPVRAYKANSFSAKNAYYRTYMDDRHPDYKGSYKKWW